MVEFNRDDYPIRPRVSVPKTDPGIVRNADAAVWAAANPVLDAGEPGIELDTKVYKIGDGVTAWNALATISGGSGGGGGGSAGPGVVFAGLDEIVAGYETLEFQSSDSGQSWTPTALTTNTGAITLSGGAATVGITGLYQVGLQLSADNVTSESISPLTISTVFGGLPISPQRKWESGAGTAFLVGVSTGGVPSDPYVSTLVANQTIALQLVQSGFQATLMRINMTIYPMILGGTVS